MTRSRSLGLLVGLFVAAFFVRAYHPISRPVQWMVRARAFNRALDARNWFATYQSYHPGFTTMAIGGLALRLYDAATGTPAEACFNWADFPFATRRGRRMAAGVMGLSLTLAGLIIASVLVLRLLAGWRIALIACGLMTFAPFTLAQSRRFHVDGLLSEFMLLSALLLLLGLQTRKRRYLLWSGLVGGLSLLTKTPAAFLVPFTALALLSYAAKELRACRLRQGEQPWGELLQRVWRDLFQPGLLWVLMAAVPFAAWPAMWVRPLSVLSGMFAGVHEHVEDPHLLPVFFAGEIYRHTHPSVFFYPVTLAFDSSFVTLTLALLAVGHYTLWRRRMRLRLEPLGFWLLTAYAFFFTVQMALGAKQWGRYLLPVHLVLELLAAVGLAGLISLMAEATGARGARAVQATVSTGLAIGLQALVAATHMPNYGAHHNYLLGGNLAAARVVSVAGEDEGVTDVADYLNRQPGARTLRVRTDQRTGPHLRQYFSGRCVYGLRMRADYHLFELPLIQRGLYAHQWRSAWRMYRNRTPGLVVTFDGVEVLWLYATNPSEPTRPTVVSYGWNGWIGIAWLWTAVLTLTTVWTLSRHGRNPE